MVEPTAPPPSVPEEPAQPVVSARLRTTIALVITLAWGGGLVADAAIVDYEVSPFVHAMMLGLGVSVFGKGFASVIR